MPVVASVCLRAHPVDVIGGLTYEKVYAGRPE